MLGKGRGRGGNDGSRWRVRERLEHAATHAHEVTVWAGVRLMQQAPRAPHADGAGERLRDLLAGQRLGKWLPRRGELQGKRLPLPGCDSDARTRRTCIGVQRNRRGRDVGAWSTLCAQPTLAGDQNRHSQAVLRARRDVDGDVHVALEALNDAENGVRWMTAAASVEGGSQHHGIGDVGSLGARAVDRRDTPMAGVWPEQPGEDRWRIESLNAGPVDRPVSANQCASLAVGDECVVGDRRCRPGRRRAPSHGVSSTMVPSLKRELTSMPMRWYTRGGTEMSARYRAPTSGDVSSPRLGRASVIVAAARMQGSPA